MNKVLILYDSATGNTAKMAELVAQGAVFGVTDYVGKLTTLHYGAVTAREPRDDQTQQACHKLGKRLAEWVAVCAGGRQDQHPLAKSDERLAPG